MAACGFDWCSGTRGGINPHGYGFETPSNGVRAISSTPLHGVFRGQPGGFIPGQDPHAVATSPFRAQGDFAAWALPVLPEGDPQFTEIDFVDPQCGDQKAKQHKVRVPIGDHPAK